MLIDFVKEFIAKYDPTTWVFLSYVVARCLMIDFLYQSFSEFRIHLKAQQRSNNPRLVHGLLAIVTAVFKLEGTEERRQSQKDFVI